MQSPAVAIGWEFRRRHAWPLIAMGVFLVALAVARLLIGGPADPIHLIPPDGRAAVVIAPLSCVYFYYLAVFSYGLSGDLAARQSIFPARMFTLPVRTHDLVWGPLSHGMIMVAAPVLAATLLARWPWGIETQLLSPALFAASFLGWTQALMWMPYGMRGLRVIVTVLWLVVLDAAVLLAMHYKVSEPAMLALLAPQIPLAYLVARYALSRARSGDVPDWRLPFGGLVRTTGREAPGRDFASPGQAQAWFEWRRSGRSLPAMVAMVLPVELSLLWIASDAPGLVLELFILVLITPPLMAAFTGTSVSKSNPDAGDTYGMSTFVGTRPLSSAALIGAKLKMAMWSTLAAWVLVLVALPIALKWSGCWPMVVERATRVIEIVGLPRAIAFELLVVAGLMASTWKLLVQSLFIGLTGRAWIIRSSVVAVLAVIVLVGPVLQWMADNKRAQGALWVALPTIFAVLVVLKMSAAAWVAARLTRSGLLSDRALVGGAVIWVAVVFALFGVLAWLFDAPLIPRYVLLLIAILAIPLARVSAAPLALAWNRHR